GDAVVVDFAAARDAPVRGRAELAGLAIAVDHAFVGAETVIADVVVAGAGLEAGAGDAARLHRIAADRAEIAFLAGPALAGPVAELHAAQATDAALARAAIAVALAAGDGLLVLRQAQARRIRIGRAEQRRRHAHRERSPIGPGGVTLPDPAAFEILLVE